MLVNDPKKNRAGHIVSLAFGVIMPPLILGVIFTSVVYGCIQNNKFTFWLQNYLSHLMRIHHNNSMLLLFAKNIEKTVSKEYIMSYAKPMILGLLIGSIVTVFALLTVNLLYYHSIKDKEGKKTVRQNYKENVTKKHTIVFFLAFCISTAAISATFLFLVLHYVAKDVPSLLSGYINKVVPDSQKNGFIQVFKGIVTETFKTQPKYDLFAKIRHDIVIFFSVLLAVSGTVALILLIYSFHDYRKDKTEKKSSPTNNDTTHTNPSGTVAQSSTEDPHAGSVTAEQSNPEVTAPSADNTLPGTGMGSTSTDCTLGKQR